MQSIDEKINKKIGNQKTCAMNSFQNIKLYGRYKILRILLLKQLMVLLRFYLFFVLLKEIVKHDVETFIIISQRFAWLEYCSWILQQGQNLFLIEITNFPFLLPSPYVHVALLFLISLATRVLNIQESSKINEYLFFSVLIYFKTNICFLKQTYFLSKFS